MDDQTKKNLDTNQNIPNNEIKDVSVPLAGNIPENKIESTHGDPMHNKDVNTENNIENEITQRELPKEVLAAQKLDRDNYKKAQFSHSENKQVENLNKPAKASLFIQKFKEVLKKESTLVKIFLLIPGCLIALFLVMGLAYLANVDTAIFKITMQGTIKDSETLQPVSYARILINGQEKAASGTNGSYQISNLSPQISEVKVQAEGYDDLTKQIAITRGFLAYTVTQDFVLTSSEKATVTGKLIPNQAKYDFSSDKLTINDKAYKISNDGTFEAKDVKVGNAILKFQSLNFTDVEKSYVIKTGVNKLQDILLEPAGDITGELKSYVAEDLVLGTQFNIENVPINQVKIEDNGNFTLQDLDVDRKYKIKVIAPKYKTRDYEIEIKQGENKLFNFKLVENFSALFLRKVNNDIEFFVSDLDGSNSEQLTFIRNLEPSSWYLDHDSQTVYFLSDYENIRGVNSGTAKVAYSIDLNTNKQTTLTSNQTGLGDIYSNFRAKKLFNIISNNTFNNKSQKLQVMDLNGESRKDIKTLQNGTFSYTFISDNGAYIYFIENSTSSSPFYRVSINDNESKLISEVGGIVPFDSTNDGQKVIFSRKNNATGFNDLALYSFFNNETRILDDNFDGKDYQFIKGSDDKILYFANRNGRYNIFQFIISQNKDEKITNLGSDDVIRDIFQSKNYLFYYTNKGLYVLDINKPQNFKLVTNEVILP